jgi:uncharacterized protein YecE (DUF72 family)
LIRVGSAGWSYPDWEGIVYPAQRAKEFDPLAYLAEFLDCVEINASFYRIPEPGAVASWAARVAARPEFRFTAKLWRGFTHEPAADRDGLRASEAAFREAMRPLREAGRLAAVLAQFPYAFHNTARNRARLEEIFDRFADLPLAVEIRHRSWLAEEFLAHLRERGVAFCNIDQPAVSANVPPTAHVTAPIAYVRLHGRNASAWFEEGAGRDRRYDYLYSVEELSSWTDRAATLAAGARDVFIIANNHFRGQGIANSVEMKSILAGGPVEAPAEILDAYPRLAGRIVPLPQKTVQTREPAQGMLPLR